MDTKPAPHDALSIIIFDHDVTLHLNGEDIRALHFPAGHTDGDSIIFFPHSNVVHRGDDFVTYGFPFIDVESGGSINGMIDAVQQVVSQLPADVKVIPGALPGLEPRRCASLSWNAEGNARCSAEGFERGQDSRPDEAG
jgi:cyclase